MSATDHSTTVEDLDWHRFCAAYFPGSGRDDLEAIVAYGAYKRSLAAGDQPARGTAQQRSRLTLCLSKSEKTKAARCASRTLRGRPEGVFIRRNTAHPYRGYGG